MNKKTPISSGFDDNRPDTEVGEQIYRDIVENVNEGIVVVQDEKIAYANLRAFELIQGVPDDLFSRNFLDFIHPDDQAVVFDRYQRRLQGEENLGHYDFRVMGTLGLVTWVQVSALLVTWKGRVATLNFLMDISQRKRAEESLRKAHDEQEARVKQRTADLHVVNMRLLKEIEKREAMASALRKNEEKYRKIFETMEDVYFRADLDGIIVDISPACEKLLGSTPDELIGKPMGMIHNNQGIHATVLTDLSRNKAINDYEVSLTHRNGRIIPLSVNMHILYDRNGNPSGYEGSARDITRRKRAEQALHESEERFRAIFAHQHNGIAIINPVDHTITDINPYLSALIGLPKEQIIGKVCHTFICTAETGRCPITDLGQRIDNAERDLMTADGRQVPIIKTVSSVMFGTKQYLVENIQDFTEQKKARNTLKRQAITRAVLNDLLTTANSAKDVEEVTRIVLDAVLNLLGYNAGGIYLVDPGEATATLVYHKNLSPDILEEVKTVSTFLPPYNILFSGGKPIITSHYDEVNPKRSQKTGILSLASFPIISRGRIIGALNVASKQRNEISGDDAQILLIIGQELGSTIERIMALLNSKKAADNLTTLFNSIEEMLFILDMDGRIQMVNSTVKKRLLYTEEDLTGRDVLFLHPPERRDEAMQNVLGMIKGKIDSCFIPVICKDGTSIEVETKVTKGIWNDQDVLIGVTRDITERKKTERELKRSKELLALAISGSGVGLWDWNILTGEVVLNERWAEILGYSLAELQPVLITTWTSLIHPDDREMSDLLISQHFTDQIPDYDCEMRMRHKEGQFIWVLIRGRVTGRSSEGKPLRMTGTLLDITRRKSLEKELEASKQELESRVENRTRELADTIKILENEIVERKYIEVQMQLANYKLNLINDVMYQDIQNKVTALRGYTNLIKDTEGEERAALIKTEEEILSTIHSLIAKTKEYQKMGTEKPAWLELNFLISRQRHYEGVQVILDPSLNGLFLYTDPLMSRVFDILIENALIHGKSLSRILFSSMMNSEGITVVCEDDGVGISEKEKKTVFDRVVAGQGKFGLFFVQQFLNLSGMTITETGEPGKGAKFEISVPVGAFWINKAGISDVSG
jgi:PAS domain S-box-containing protein